MEQITIGCDSGGVPDFPHGKGFDFFEEVKTGGYNTTANGPTSYWSLAFTGEKTGRTASDGYWHAIQYRHKDGAEFWVCIKPGNGSIFSRSFVEIQMPDERRTDFVNRPLRDPTPEEQVVFALDDLPKQQEPIRGGTYGDFTDVTGFSADGQVVDYPLCWSATVVRVHRFVEGRVETIMDEDHYRHCFECDPPEDLAYPAEVGHKNTEEIRFFQPTTAGWVEVAEPDNLMDD